MKILLVDDSPTKIRNLVAFISDECGVAREDIDVVQNAQEARRRLRDASYDILILDILLPRRPEDEPTAATSIELLEELSVSSRYRRPRYVIGMTAYGDALANAGPRFAERAWTVVSYNEVTTEWQGPIQNCIRYVEETPRERVEEFDYDLCVVTALQSEMDEVYRLSWNWSSSMPIDDTTFVTTGSFDCGERTFRVVAAVAPRMGMVASALLTSKLIAKYRPRFICMVGICAGVRQKTELGDVICVDPSWDYQCGKHTIEDGSPVFAISPHQISPPEFIRSRVDKLSRDNAALTKIKSAWSTASVRVPRLLSGPVASGSAVLAVGEIVDRIRGQQHRNLLGVEMEVYGVFASSALAGRPRPTALAFKSVCDFGDPSKDDSMQPYAAFTSAQLMREFFERYMVEIRDSAGT